MNLDMTKLSKSGTGSATLNISESYTPVPISTPVDKVIINTSLSNEEIHNILANVLHVEEWTSFTDLITVIFVNMSAELGLYVFNEGAMSGEPDAFVILGFMEDTELPIWIDPALEVSYGISGWVQETIEALGGNEIVLGGLESDTTWTVEGEVIPIGEHNNALSKLFSTNIIEAYTKELTGTYDNVEIETSTNGGIDLLPYIDNKQIPTQIYTRVTLSGTFQLDSNATPLPSYPGMYYCILNNLVENNTPSDLPTAWDAIYSWVQSPSAILIATDALFNGVTIPLEATSIFYVSYEQDGYIHFYTRGILKMNGNVLSDQTKPLYKFNKSNFVVEGDTSVTTGLWVLNPLSEYVTSDTTYTVNQILTSQLCGKLLGADAFTARAIIIKE